MLLKEWQWLIFRMVQVVCFGFDIWGGQVQHQQYPELFSFVKKQALVVPNCPTNRTISQSLSFTPLCGSFCTNGAATTSKQSANFRQSGLVAIYLGKYSVFLQKGLLTSHWSCSSSPAFKWLWKSSCQNKHKVFFWLLLKDRLAREIY